MKIECKHKKGFTYMVDVGDMPLDQVKVILENHTRVIKDEMTPQKK